MKKNRATEVPRPLRSAGSHSTCGHGDLLRAYAEGGKAGLTAAAVLAGYVLVRDVEEETSTDPITTDPGDRAKSDLIAQPEPSIPADIPFWRLERCEFLQEFGDRPPPVPPKAAGTEWRGLPPSQSMTELTRWNALLPRLRSAFAQRAEGKSFDIEEMVCRIGKGLLLERLPRRMRLRWGDAMQIIEDRSRRLIPFRHDQRRLFSFLLQLYPRHAIDVALWRGGDLEPCSFDLKNAPCDYRMPKPGALVLVLGDLGCLAGDAARVAPGWEEFGRQLRRAGCRPVALTPCPPGRWRQELLPSWTMLAWELKADVSRRGKEELERRTERLLRLLSPAIRIEPGLLREIRLSLGSEADAGTEADVWSHGALDGWSSVAARLDPKAANDLRREFAQELDQVQRQVLQMLRQWRGGGLAPEVYFEEILSLDPACQALLPPETREADLAAAKNFFKQTAPRLQEIAGGRAWYRDLYWRKSDS